LAIIKPQKCGTADKARVQYSVKLGTTKHPYMKETLDGCYAQPEAVARALRFGGRLSNEKVLLDSLDNKFELLSEIKHMTLSACGSSLNAARYAECLMKSIDAFNCVDTIDASDPEVSGIFSCYNDEPKRNGLIVVSQKDQAQHVHTIAKSAMAKNIACLSVAGSIGSLVAPITNLSTHLNALKENAVASNEALTTQVTALALVALWFRQTKDIIEGRKLMYVESKKLKESLMRLPIILGKIIKMTRPQCKQVAERLQDKRHCVVVGQGYGESVAMEGALKIKETCNIRAEGHIGDDVKHCTLINNNDMKLRCIPIIMLIFDDEHASHMRTVAKDVKARGFELIIITDKKKYSL